MTPAELRTQRNKLGLSQAALASILQVRQATVSDWENDKQAIPHMLSLALEVVAKR
jgi:DNA-binding transcriptional regulator YiaG